MIWMWEAKAAPQRADDLLDWALTTLGDRDGEVYRSLDQPDDLVIIVLRVPPAGPGLGAGTGWPLPGPPPGLVAGRAQAWPFERMRRD